MFYSLFYKLWHQRWKWVQKMWLEANELRDTQTGHPLIMLFEKEFRKIIWSNVVEFVIKLNSWGVYEGFPKKKVTRYYELNVGWTWWCCWTSEPTFEVWITSNNLYWLQKPARIHKSTVIFTLQFLKYLETLIFNWLPYIYFGFVTTFFKWHCRLLQISEPFCFWYISDQ